MATISEKKHRLPIFEKRFHELRDELNMSQIDFATFLGISRPTVGLYENGDRIPDAAALMSLASRCNVSSDWLIGLSDIRRYENSGIGRALGLNDQAIERLKLAGDRLDIHSDNLLGLRGLVNNIICSDNCDSLLLNISMYRKALKAGIDAHDQIKAHPQEHIQACESSSEAVKRFGYQLINYNDTAKFKLHQAEEAFGSMLKSMYGEVKEDGTVIIR